MPKVINLKNAQRKQQIGINAVVDAMAITIGPRGKNVSLTNGDTVNDGKRIAEDTILKDAVENKGAEKVKRLVRAISTDVGGGRTAGAILYKNLIEVGLNLLERGYNANLIKRGMNLAVKDITEQLDKMAKPAKGHLKQIATISTESEDLGKVIAEILEKVGSDGIVTVEQSNSFGITSHIEDGLKCNQGYLSPYMVTDVERMEATYKDIAVLITDKKISSPKDLIPAMNTLDKKNKKDLLVIAEDVDESVLKFCAINKANGLFNTLAIKIPGVGDMKKFTLEDLSALTGAMILTEANWDSNLETKNIPHQATGQIVPMVFLKQNVLGHVNKVVSKKDSTIIFGGNTKNWITTLKTRREMTENKWEIDQFNERIAKLQNGIAVIKVGASSEDEVKYLKLKIEDGVNETKRALEEGIITGGDVAFVNAIKSFEKRSFKTEEEGLGYKIVLDAVSAPLRQIVINSKGSPDVVVNEIWNSKSLTIGYNSLDNEVVEDMYSLGIIDAVKVVKTVLKYAVTEAALFLSIGGDISEETKDETPRV